MKLPRFLYIAFLLLTFELQAQIARYSDEVKVIHIDTLNGAYNGAIKLWNNNGVLLLEGNYKDHQKTGQWIFYDSLGNPKVIREYQNSYYFSTIEGEDLVSVSVNREKSGMLKLPDVKSEDIVNYKNVYRYILQSDINTEIFENDRLWIILIGIINNNIPVYKDSRFEEVFSEFELNKIVKDYKNIIIAFQISEIHYLDKSTKSFQRRITGISPVFSNEQKNNLWFYYPEIREALSLEKIYKNDWVQSFDDLFYFEEFQSVPLSWTGMNYEKYNGVEYDSRQERLEIIADFDFDLLKTEHKIITE